MLRHSEMLAYINLTCNVGISCYKEMSVLIYNFENICSEVVKPGMGIVLPCPSRRTVKIQVGHYKTKAYGQVHAEGLTPLVLLLEEGNKIS